jgi:two-component system, NtrC family, sensor kinase
VIDARSRSRWLPLAGLAVVLATLLVFLYVKTAVHDSSGYFENVALLRQLKQLDAQWELDVLKSKIGATANYDSLVNPLAELNELRERLEGVVAGEGHASPAALAASTQAFSKAIDEKARLIEHFKSHNAVLRNSLAFLPTAADEARPSVGGIAGGDPAVRKRASTQVDDVLLGSLVYSQSPSNEKAAQIQGDLTRLLYRTSGSPIVPDGLMIFTAHVQTVMREQPLVDALLKDVAAVPTAARIDAIDNLLGKEQRENSGQDRRYRQYLLIFAAAMSGLLLYVAIGLIRSHAVINRVNHELLGSNAALEQRVDERTRELRVAQGDLVTAARQAGMAEIASNVLHNVGNVLNSVNISAGLVSAQLHASKAKGLARAVGLIDAHSEDLGQFFTSDAKGRLLPGYLRGLSQSLEVEQRGMVAELAGLSKSVDHIKEIVATQQSYAGASSMVEAVRIDELVDDALRISASSATRSDIEIIKDTAGLPMCLVDRHRLMQILVNLLTNARRAVDTSCEHGHRITVRADAGADEQLRIRVSDNGEGIAAENLGRLFSHGFTTRKDGHGFGLHSCVIAAQEMGGALTAQSDGPGQGATFTLLLPMKVAKEGA